MQPYEKYLKENSQKLRVDQTEKPANVMFTGFSQYILKIFFIYTQQKTCPYGQVFFNNDEDYRPLRRAVSCAIINSSLVGITTATALLSAVVITPALPKRAFRLASWSMCRPRKPK